MEPLDVLEVAGAGFRDRLTAIGPDQWGLPTPCDDWTVRDLVGHVVRGQVMAVLLLGGTSRDETLAAMAGPIPDDLLGGFDETARRQSDAFRQPGAMERTCHHVVGDIPGSMLLGFRTGDLGLHTWDLARAIGADETLPPEVLETIWAGLSPMAAIIGESGFFGAGPSGLLPDDAPLQLRVLDVSGRRP